MTQNFKYILLSIGVVLLAVCLWYFRSIVAYILISVVVSLVGHPLVELLKKIKFKSIKLSQSICAAITLFVIWAVVIGFLRVFIPLMSSQANELSSIDVNSLVEMAEEPLSKIEGLVEQMNLDENENKSLEDIVIEKIQPVLKVSFIKDIFDSIAGVIGNIFVAFFAISFISFFFLKDQTLFKNAILTIAPEKYQDKIRKVMTSSKKLLSRYFIGIIIEVTLVATLITIGLSIIGVKFETAIIAGLFAGLMNVIPYVGPIIGAAVGVVLGVVTNLDMDFYSGILPLMGYIALTFIIVQVLDNVVFQPIIYSNSVNAHPLEIFLVIMIAGSIAGIPGMVLAIPSYTILRVIGKEFFNKIRFVNKLTKNIED